MGLVVTSILSLFWMMQVPPTTLVPTEDTGTLMGMVSMPPGTSQDRTDEVLQQVEKMVMASPLVKNTMVISGFSMMGGQGSSYGSFFIKLKPWEERNAITESARMVFINLLLESQKSFKDAQVFFFQPPMIMGYGMTNGFTLNLQDRTGGELSKFKEVSALKFKRLRRPSTRSSLNTSSTLMPHSVSELVSHLATFFTRYKDISVVYILPTSIALVRFIVLSFKRNLAHAPTLNHSITSKCAMHVVKWLLSRSS